MKTKQIIICNCRGKRGGDILDADLAEYLNNKKISCRQVSDLCGMAARNKDTLSSILHAADQTMIVACTQRSIRLIADYAGILLKQDKFYVCDRFKEEASELRLKIDEFCGSGSLPELTSVESLKSDESEIWNSWYPIIDYDRCSSCGNCAQFCLFGVYEQKKGKVRVINPAGCKDLCPACARICPEAAIVFPKYEGGGAIGGSDTIDEAAEKHRIKDDLQEIADNDIYATLQKRKEKRLSLLKEGVVKRAEKEREEALAESAQDKVKKVQIKMDKK